MINDRVKSLTFPAKNPSSSRPDETLHKPLRKYCSKCHKAQELCVCAHITPINTHIKVLILQHPQEADKDLGTAMLTHLSLPSSTLRVGLSWPNLQAALGEKTIPQNWAVLYLGSKKNSLALTPSNEEVYLFNAKNKLLPSKETLNSISGIVVLDGNWQQAKTLWWRNSWLLKLKRIVLAPKRRSLYGKLRREPRRESVSTLEATAIVLSLMEEKLELQDVLLRPLKELLRLYNIVKSSRH